MKPFLPGTVLLAALIGCEKRLAEPLPAPAKVPAVEAGNPVPEKKVEPPAPAGKRFPTDQAKFKAAVWASTRDQIIGRYGQPDEVYEDAPNFGWDGPTMIYLGPFTDANGAKKEKAVLWFARRPAGSVVDFVDFIDGNVGK